MSQLKFFFSQDELNVMFRGVVEELQLYGTYKYEDSNGKERENRNWFTVPVNWSTNGKWVWRCFKIADVVAPALNPKPKEDRLYGIRHMKIKNKYVAPIYMDELRVGKIRGNSFKMRQTRKAITFDGQVPKKFNVWRVKGRGRQKFGTNILPKISTQSYRHGANFVFLNRKIEAEYSNIILEHIIIFRYLE